MDAFDFLFVVFLVDTLAERFGVSKKEIIWKLTATLARIAAAHPFSAPC
jgi:hypothetical protein